MSLTQRRLPTLLGLLLGLLLCACLAPGAWADGSTVQQLQTAIQNGETSFTLTGDMTVNNEYIDGVLGASMTLTVPVGKTLTIINGDVNLAGLDLGGTVELKSGGRLRVNNSLTYSGGVIQNGGTFRLYLPGSAVTANPDMVAFPAGRGACNLLFYANTEDDITSAQRAAGAMSERFGAMIYICFDWTLNSKFTVPEREDIIISGERGGSFALEKGGVLEMTPRNTLVLESGAEARLSGAVVNGGITVNENTGLFSSGSVDIDTLRLGGSVTLSGGIFRVNNKLNCQGGTVELAGPCFDLFPAEDILALGDHYTDVFSWTDNRYVICPLFTPMTDAEAEDAVTQINGLDERFFADLAIAFPWTVTGNQAITHKTQLRIDCGAGGSLTVAKGASFSHTSRGNVFINNNGRTENLPPCENLGFMNVGTLHIEPGCTFTAAGITETGELELGGTLRLEEGCIFRVNYGFSDAGGTAEVLGKCFNLFPAADVWPDNTGFLQYAHDGLKSSLLFRATNAAQFADALGTINGLTDRFIADLQINGRCDLEGENIFRHKANIRVNADQGGSLHLAKDALLVNNGNGGNVFFNNNSRAASPAVSEIYGELNTNGLSLDPGCVLSVGENGWVKTHDALEIPEGAKLTLTKGQLHLMDNSTATVSGTLENNGYINLRQRSGGKPRLVIEGGSYSGDGRIDVADTVDTDSYFAGLNLDLFTRIAENKTTIYLPYKIDLILPSSLTEIEAEAFADDTFGSVYIPAGVTLIDPMAFNGVDRLVIYGKTNSAAENYASGRFEFIPVG